MENISTRIQLLVDEHAGGNVSEFAKIIGVKVSTCHNYVKNRSPKAEALFQIHVKLNVNVNWLLTGEGDQYITNDDPDLQPSIVDMAHSEMVKTFRNKEEAKEFNLVLKEIEDLDERKFFEALGYIKNQLSHIRKNPNQGKKIKRTGS